MKERKIIDNYISRLKTVKTKAYEEKVTTQCIYLRIKNGLYNTVVSDGITFIEE